MKISTEKTMGLRLAMRVEGNWWVAYAAEPQTMQGAVRLGKIAMDIVSDPDRKRAFMDLMKSYIGDVLSERGGIKDIQWPEPQAAPEHERAGRA
jgi:hypothetical protein